MFEMYQEHEELAEAVAQSDVEKSRNSTQTA